MKFSLAKNPALAAFAAEVNHPDNEVNLTRAALQMGRFEYPDLDIGLCEYRVAQLADTARDDSGSGQVDPIQLAGYLYDRLGFRGNTDNYLDPRNSFLNEVLERRLGIPISLSVLYMAVARAVGIETEGIGLPGHFIIRVQAPGLLVNQFLFLDPFHGGALLNYEDCRKRVEEITSGSIVFNETFLQPVGAHYILMRMLNNLKNVYAKSSDFSRARHVVERLLVLDPNNRAEIRNLGLLYSALGNASRAVELLESYLEGNPEAPDREAVKTYLVGLTRNMARWN